MTKKERELVRIVCEEAFTNKDENPYDIYRTLDECYSSYSYAKEKAYYDCEHKFSEDVNCFFKNVEKYKLFTFTRIISHSKTMFTLLQGAYYFSKNDSLVALLRYDTKAKVVIRGFVLNKMSHDLISMKRSVSDIVEMIKTNY